jgi:nitrogen regulatory protein P-II 1
MVGIKAVIRVTKFDDVKDALLKIGVEFFTYYDVRGVTFQAEQKGTYRGNSIMDSTSIQKRVLELVVPNEEAQEVVDCIKAAAATGVVGDGKIYTYEIKTSTRISN